MMMCVKLFGPISQSYRLKVPLDVTIQPHPSGVVAHVVDLGIEVIGDDVADVLRRTRHVLTEYFDWLRTYKPRPSPGMRAEIARLEKVIVPMASRSSHTDRADQVDAAVTDYLMLATV